MWRLRVWTIAGMHGSSLVAHRLVPQEVQPKEPKKETKNETSGGKEQVFPSMHSPPLLPHHPLGQPPALRKRC